MASHYEAPLRKPLVTGDQSYHDVTVDIAAPVEERLTTVVDCFQYFTDSIFMGIRVYYLYNWNWYRNMGFK